MSTAILSSFDTAEALALNKARMDHLASLNLPINGETVLDVGCGVGHLAQFFLERHCDVTCLDARLENITRLHAHYPSLRAYVYDIEAVVKLDFRYHTVFCYGLLYHLQNPLQAMKRLADLTRKFLLLETIVLDSHDLSILYDPEDVSDPNQSITGLGSRPSYLLIRRTLRNLFPHVYEPEPQPAHADFQWRPQGMREWRRDGHLLRSVFIGSRIPLPL